MEWSGMEWRGAEWTRMERIGEVLKHLEELLRVLSELDIIGQHRESIVISETKS